MDLVNRTFVGVRLPEPITQQIEQSVMVLRRKPGGSDVRWNAPSELLITLCQLGEISVEKLSALRTLLPAAAKGFGPIVITLQGFSGVPNIVQPRYAVSPIVGDVEKLVALEASLWRTASQVLGPREAAKPFQPHVVLGRLKTESEQLRVALGRALKTADQPVMGSLQVNVVELLISNASTSGVGYTVIEELPLG
jgi:RNA 2',3'-cyclic 3'-phosphodiesterase